jgi:hypothetical protein
MIRSAHGLGRKDQHRKDGNARQTQTSGHENRDQRHWKSTSMLMDVD